MKPNCIPWYDVIIMLIGGVCEGVGLSLVFMRGATTGGTDMIARLLNHRLRHLSMGKLMLAVDGCVVLFSAIVYKSIESAVYACIVIFVSTKIIDTILYGTDAGNGKMFFIMSHKNDVIADRIITAVTTLVGNPEQYAGTYVFIAMLFYAFELYCDFTGGIDITIGIAEVMGIRVAETFNLPYFSKNIKEYWNRWHITMGTWFTDYIFYPISVCGPMLKLSKWSRAHLGETIGKRVPVYLSSFVVWFATGIWHGAAWNFIVWGLMNFVVIMISQELEPLYAKFHHRFAVEGKAPWEVFRIIRTILLMSCIRMFDCYRDVPLTFKMVGTMFTQADLSVFTNGSLLGLGITAADYLVLVAGFVIVLSVSLYKYHRGPVREALYAKPTVVYYGAMALLFVLTIIFGAYGVGYDSSQFIYNQF